MKHNISTIIITAIISSALTAFGMYTFGFSKVISEPTSEQQMASQKGLVECGEPIAIETKGETNSQWETLSSEIAGFELQMPKEYGWRWDSSPNSGEFTGVSIVKDGEQNSLPLITIFATGDAPASKSEEVVAIQPITMEKGEGRKITFLYDGESNNKKEIGSYYLFGYKGKTYKVSRFVNTSWELFDEIAKTFTFVDVADLTK
ncbi:MAG: hypothetical protein GW939_03685 [Candidatus Magasanikbacteria bacterium]|uniref:Uncharacterized protein n=1 Tax=Candidatus Magasanikbacteria bacterium CG10_big_fil_rev_8_21_14_0_10_38_6 TaxID=1974647 RepID=A0A2M6NZW5_9BACT|nr:hypothetical protein [Candidatus Magasanikbacteria bacterium]NCS71815.1 hypothetical protein [Candidatus Magasanikbacteria bacterium]PIR77023.1 MAG: hypothetical protein COU30_04750 [Candidatus Magasanikbacteria bacterium CG10_big_fil_rev_8_21_14_0_10_38_6]